MAAWRLVGTLASSPRPDLGMAACVSNPRVGGLEEGKKGGSWKLNTMVGFSFRGRPCLKKQVEKWWRKIPNITLWSPHEHNQPHNIRMHAHTYTKLGKHLVHFCGKENEFLIHQPAEDFYWMVYNSPVYKQTLLEENTHKWAELLILNIVNIIIHNWMQRCVAFFYVAFV